MKINQIIVLLKYCSIISYVLALINDAYLTSSGGANGLLLLFIGPFGLVMDIGNLLDCISKLFETGYIAWHLLTGASFSWIANLLLPFAWIFVTQHPKRSYVFSASAFTLIVSFSFSDFVLTGSGGGGKEKIEALSYGYFFWLASALLIWIASIYGIKKEKIRVAQKQAELI